MHLYELIELLKKKSANKEQHVVVEYSVTAHCQGADETYEILSNIYGVRRDNNTLIIELKEQSPT